MKKAILFLFFFAVLASVALGQNANDWFVTRWVAPANGEIKFPAIGSGYTIRYVPINHITGAPIGTMQTISPASSGQVISGLTAGWTYRIDAYGGTFNRFDFSYYYYNRQDIVRLEQWGTTQWATMSGAFFGCGNMDVTATDVPDLSACQDISDMFCNCTSLVNGNGSISGWQTANVTNMQSMFGGAQAFNQPLSNWNTANVTNMSQMFYKATAFNQPLNWNTGNVTNMEHMFSRATAFNQPLNWNTENVTDMSSMFEEATAFNQPLDGFEINAIVDMRDMLKGCGMSCQNLSTTLDSWATQATALGKNNVNLGDISTVPNAYNETGQAAINTLKNNHNWTITGGQLAPGCILPAYYVSEWDLSKPVWPARSDAATTLVTNLIGTNFVVMWENMANPSDNGIESSANGTAASPFKITGLTAGAKYRIIAFSTSATNKLTGLCAEKADYQRLTKVTHWGTTQWTSLTKAFSGCGNMDITATDKPDLSAVTDLSMMFQTCGSLVYNTSINDWDVSHVTNMSGMFATATEFNQPLNNWDVSHVTNMSSMFAEAVKFNQPLNNWVVSSVTNMSGTFVAAMKFNQNINSWNVSNVTDMSNMFGNADDFNQPLNNWVTSKVTNMSGMFSMASKFNQDINSWDVSKVTNMSDMFNNAKVFNKPLNNWDVSKVTNMNSMFRYTDLFNQDITGWNVSAVTNMQSMFERALVFNQDIKGWNTRNVTDMRSMFKQAAAFDRDLGLLRIDALTNGTEMFASSGMSCDNYSKTLKGWAESGHTPSNVNFITQTGTPYGRQGKPYRDKLTSLKNWTISGDSLDFACSIGLITPDVYVSEWDLSKPELLSRPDAATTLITNLVGTNFVVEYINLADSTDKGVVNTANGIHLVPFKLTGLSAGAKYRIIAYSNPNIAGSVFSEISYQCDYKRLSKVTQWGTKKWSSLENAFWGCENMDVTATDVPDLSVCQKLNGMFYNCHNLENANGSISRWVIDNITDIGFLFAYTQKFNQPLNNWNTTNVTNMGAVFEGATLFNQPLNNWNTANVTNMSRMFSGATSFNQPIDNWNTGNVIYLLEMFKNATSFNQPLNNWNTIKTTQMNEMFYGATSFDQPLDGLEIKSVLYINDIFKDCGMSCENLSITLQSFQNQAASYLMYSRWIGALSANQYYNQTGQAAITALQARGWTITGGTYAADCLTPASWFTTVWDITKPTNRTTNNPASTIAFPGVGNNYKLYWENVNNPSQNDTLTVSSGGSSNPYYLALPAGVTKVRIKAHKASGTFDGFLHFFTDSNKIDNKRLIAVEQWGTTAWSFYGLNFAFVNCKNMDVMATDQPNFSRGPQLGYTFYGCSSLVNANGSISGWNTENLTNMNYTFMKATSFNQPLNSWNTANVSSMRLMFYEATSFNQPLNNWNTAKVTDMDGMFQGATSFNQRLDSFKINDITTMQYMLNGCGMSCENLSTTLDSWATQATALGKNNINLGGITTVPNIYNETGKAAINVLKNNHNWTIIGGRFARDCVSPDYYVSVWDMSQPATTGSATSLTTNLWGTNFKIEWINLNPPFDRNSATVTATTAPYTITGLTAGKRYRVIAYTTPLITGSILKKLATEDGGGVTRTDVARLDSVTQWGANKWMSLEGAFRHCSRMDVTATDKPDLTMLSGNKSLNFMFEGCENLVYNSTINNWVTTGVTDMSGMFSGAKAFNQPLDGWDVSNVKYMSSMFFKAEAFNQDLNSWQTGNVERMQDMFNRAKAFNGNITTWNTGKVTNMQAMFYGAEAFNKALGWNTENVTDMSSMFQNAKAFNNGTTMNGMGYWNVEKVTTMKNMFLNAEAFNQDLAGWTLRSITDMRDIFSAPLNKGMSCANYSSSLQGWASKPHTNTGVDFTGQSNRVYNAVGKIARDSLSKPVAQGGKGWNMSATTDSYDESCGMHVWLGTVSTDISDINNWQSGTGMPPHIGIVSGYEYNVMVYISPSAVRDMHVTPLPVTPPYTPGAPNNLEYWIIHNLVNKTTNRKVVVEPAANLYIHNWIDGSSTPADVDKIVVKADDTNPNGSLILAGQPCDKPVYATVEMYSKANREATAMTWTDNIPSSPTKDSLFSVHYRWQYIGIPVEGEYANAFYGSYLRKYDETYNDPNHYYGKWRKLGADETWQPLVPFAGYEVTSRTPKVYVFKGRLLHCPQELTLTRQAAEVSAVPSSFNDPRERRWELGHNVFGNSYTSALMIGQGKLFVDLEGWYPLGQEPIEGTVYVYNTGSIADWAGGGTLGSGPGQYVAVPVFSATALSEQYISSMQGFMLKFKEDTLRINGVGSPVKFRIGLNKEEHYLSNIYPFGGNQRPQRAPQAAPSDKIHGYLKIGLTSRRSVSSVHLIEAEGTTDEFDNGWDGMQLNTGRSSSATLFVPSEYGDLQVSTSDNIVGDRFGIVNNGDTTYRLTVIRHRLDNRGELYLYDVATNRYTLLDADTTVYDFTSEGSGNVDKRFVITDRRNADDPNTAVEEAAEDMSLYGYVDGRHTLVVNNHTAEAGTLTLLDVSGKAVYTSPFGVGFSRHDLSHLPAGVYIARLEASVRRATVKAITMK